MRAADGQAILTGMTGLLADRGKHERATGDRFRVLIRIGQTANVSASPKVLAHCV